MRAPQLALIALFALSLAQSWMAYPEMPERMASHFGADGRADGFSSKDMFFALFALLDGAMVMVFLGLPWLVPRMPVSMVNLPHREYWLVPERRDQARQLLSGWLGWFGVATLMFMMGTKHLVIAANGTASSGSPEARLDGLFGWGLGAYLLFTVLWIFGLYRGFRIPEGSGFSQR